MQSETLKQKIALLPKEPGVYVMLDKDEKVIYVGKAKVLKNRVTQYFQNSYKTQKVMAMVKNIEDFYYILTSTETDALSLENNLIKKYKPKYNILLKDDKSYPYIRVNLKEDYPRFTIVRKVKKDGAKYFGPYMLGVKASDILATLTEAYKLRPCAHKFNKDKQKKECLNYHLGLCLAPCAKKCSQKEYLQNVKGAIDFLNGNTDSVIEILTNKMLSYAENQEFEKATVCRDRVKMVESLKDKKITSLSRLLTCDVLAVASDGIYASVNVLFIRGGRTTAVKNYTAETLSQGDSDKIEEFINRFYSDNSDIPDELIIENCGVDTVLLSNYLTSLKGKKVSVITPEKGVKRQLLDLANKNAQDYLDRQIDKVKHYGDMTKIACERLKEILNLKNYPKRIECFDISHISGTDKVGSMVVFIDGVPSKDDYRRFKIKTVAGNDDYACMHEVLKRRLERLKNGDEKFAIPDLVVIDGGKGQLSAVKELFKEYAPTVDLISLAERLEEIFTVNSKQSIMLPKTDYCLKMLQRLRDEAHRFAITFNRNLRTKTSLNSTLLKINGIGKEKRNALLNRFKDLPSIVSASVEEIAKTQGVGIKLATKIKEYLQNERN